MTLYPNQQRYLFSEISTKHSFFITAWYRLDGPLEINRLKASITAALARHEACRTVFVRSDDGSFRSEIRPKPAFLLHHVLVANLDAVSIETASRPFLGKVNDFFSLEALHRFVILEVSPEAHAIVFAQHHAVSDGISLDILISEIGTIYSGHKADLPVPRQFSDLADKTSPDHSEFWRNTFTDIVESPRFHRSQQSDQPAPKRISFDLGVQSSEELIGRAQEGTTVFSILAAAFAAQVYRQTGLLDVIFSIQSSGRYGFAEERILGPFSNALPIRIEVNPDEPFTQLTARIRDKVRAALTHESLGYQDILRTGNVRPDFALNLYPDAEPPVFAGVLTGPRGFLTSESDYGVNLRWHRNLDGHFYLDAYYDSDSIERIRIEAFGQRALKIVSEAVRDPQGRVGDILDAARLYPQPRASTSARPVPQRIWQVVRDARRTYPDRIAIRSDAGAIDYTTLLERVEARAGALHAVGVGTNMPVAFLAQRDAEFVITMLALSRLGTAFAALDTEYPASRLAQQAKSLGISTILAVVNEKIFPSELIALEAAGIEVLCVASDATGPRPQLPPDPEDDDTAYYLFTSGTTGIPKRISVGHGALPHFLEWQASTFGVTCNDRISLLSGLAHDPVLRDIFLPLSTGATLTIPRQSMLHDPRALGAWLRAERPSIIHTTPAMGRLLSSLSGEPDFPGTRLVFWGGDMLLGDLVHATRRRNPLLTQVNFYGASETPQAVLYHSCLDDGKGPMRCSVPVGIPIQGIEARIVGGRGEICDVNEVGEVRIFTPYFVSVDGVRVPGHPEARQIYDTGDIGYRLPSGGIQLIGRRDDQVSIRGYRIELGDVELQLLALEDVAEACVLVASGPDGQSMLVGHIVAQAAGRPVDTIVLRRALSAKVPGYMVPTLIMEHATLPLLPNGKRDRRALLMRQDEIMQKAAQETSDDIAQPGRLNLAERAVANIFSEVLGRPGANPSRSFVDLGADSLNAIQAMLRLERIIPNLPEEWQDQSIATLAKLVEINGPTNSLFGVKKAVSLVQSDLSVIFRALAILSVVALHYGFFSVPGGATAILFLLAGHALVRFQLPKILSDGAVTPILSSILKVAILTIPISIIVTGVNVLQGEPFQPANIFFYANFLDYAGPHKAPGGVVWLWFIACYVQIMFLIALSLSWRPFRLFVRAHLGKALIWGFVATAIMRFAIPAAFDPDLIVSGVPIMTKWDYLPTTFLPNVLLGGLVLVARRDAGLRWICLALTVAYGVAVNLVFDANHSELVSLVVVLLIWIKSVPVPRGLSMAFMAVSKSSLYLYLLHMPLLSFLRIVLHITLPPLMSLVLAVIASFVFSIFWEKMLNFGLIGLNRLQKTRHAEIIVESKVI